MVNLKTLLRRAVFAGAPNGDRPAAATPPEKLLRGGLERRPTTLAGEPRKWQPPTKGTTPADRKPNRNRRGRISRRRLRRI